jgi:hypothetical protein
LGCLCTFQKNHPIGEKSAHLVTLRGLFLRRCDTCKQGCQMVCFQTKNPNLGKFWRALDWKMFTYFISIWNISWRFGIFYDHLAHFVFIWCIVSGLGIMYQGKSGNPACKEVPARKWRRLFSEHFVARVSAVPFRIVQKLGHGTVTWDRCCDSLNIFAEKFGDQIGVFLFKTKLNYVCKKLIITLVFEKNNNFFDDNCNHNIKTNMATLALTSFVEINVPM